MRSECHAGFGGRSIPACEARDLHVDNADHTDEDADAKLLVTMHPTLTIPRANGIPVRNGILSKLALRFLRQEMHEKPLRFCCVASPSYASQKLLHHNDKSTLLSSCYRL